MGATFGVIPSTRRERRPKFIAFLRYIDHCSYPPCRVRCPFPAERRPKFISVTVSGARFWECSTRSNWLNLNGNCYISVSAWAQRSASSPQRGANVDRNSFRSPCWSRDSGSVQPCLIGSISVVLRYVDPCPGLPCRVRCPFPAERRPKFISVTVSGARFWECSTLSNWFNLCGSQIR
jgi:hypothetical protein